MDTQQVVRRRVTLAVGVLPAMTLVVVAFVSPASAAPNPGTAESGLTPVSAQYSAAPVSACPVQTVVASPDNSTVTPSGPTADPTANAADPNATNTPPPTDAGGTSPPPASGSSCTHADDGTGSGHPGTVVPAAPAPTPTPTPTRSRPAAVAVKSAAARPVGGPAGPTVTVADHRSLRPLRLQPVSEALGTSRVLLDIEVGIGIGLALVLGYAMLAAAATRNAASAFVPAPASRRAGGRILGAR